MKHIYLLLFLLVGLSESIAQRHGNKKEEAKPGLEDTVIDTSFVLYTKSICLKLDTDTKYSIPCNCAETDLTDSSVIENEYMLLSKTQRKAVVINYIKNRNQRIFTKPKSISKFTLQGNQQVQVNIWYLNQLRFGDYDPTNNTIEFKVNDKEPIVHVWNLEFDQDDAVITSVNQRTDEGAAQIETKKSLFLVPRFYKTPKYILIYQKPYYKIENTTVVFNILENTFSVDPVTKDVYVKLHTEVKENKQYIHFNGKRVYSYYH